MKTMMLALTAFFCAFQLNVTAFAAEPKEIRIGPSDAYVPSGFDSRSDAYVVVNGVFPNSCYRWSRAEVASPTEFQHEIKIYAMVTPGMCLMVLVPYNKEVLIGKLPTGTHNLRFLNGDGTYFERALKVE